MGKPPFHEGDVVQNYVIDKQFNVGGMGAVYSIKQENILIKAPFADSGDVLLAQFKEEVKALQQLNHPGIVGILDSNINAHIPWYTMEFIQGETLRANINREAPINPLKAIRFLYHITEAIAHAHTQSKPIWHLDIKPENICFRQDKPVVLDFGLARFGRSATNILGPHGTLLYMAPEQLDLRGRPDARADVYALGVIFFEMLMGEPPFGKITEVCYENKRIECMEKILDLDLPSPKVENVHSLIQKILEKTLAKKQSIRYANAHEMLPDILEAMKFYVDKNVHKYEKSHNYSKALLLLSQASSYNFVAAEDIARLQKLQKEQEEKSLDEIFETAKTCNQFQKNLDFAINVFQKYELEGAQEKKKKLHKLVQDLLQLQELESWTILVEKINTLKEYIEKNIPVPVAEVPVTEVIIDEICVDVDDIISDEDEVKDVDGNKNVAVFEEETQIIKIPQSEISGYVASPLNEIKDIADPKKEEVHLKTSDFEDILQQSQMLKNQNVTDIQTEIKIPKGFHWFDDNQIICEKDESIMIYIPAGEFFMGSDAPYVYDYEKPEHQVYVDGFFIDKFLITWRQFLTFCDETGYQRPTPPRWGVYEEHPVVNINWLDAKEYCLWAGKILPSEAQWEKAAKGGIYLDSKKQKENPLPKRKYPWGDSLPDENGKWKANYNEEPHYGRNRGQKSTSRIGSFSDGISPYGCVDMAGNVWEWCLDWYSETYYHDSPFENPKGPTRQSATQIDSEKKEIGKVLRGGSWYTGSKYLRTTARRCRTPEGRGGSCGMRGICLIVSE